MSCSIICACVCVHEEESLTGRRRLPWAQELDLFLRENNIETISVLYSDVVSVTHPLSPLTAAFLHLCSNICQQCSRLQPQREPILRVITDTSFLYESKCDISGTFSERCCMNSKWVCQEMYVAATSVVVAHCTGCAVLCECWGQISSLCTKQIEVSVQRASGWTRC